MNGQDYEQLTLFPADSPASPFLLPESEEARRTTAISGRKCSELLKSCGPVGLLAKMYQDLFELRLMKYLKVSNRRTTPHGHILSRLVSAEPCLQESALPLWPRPTTGAPLCGGTHNFRQMTALRDAEIITEEEQRNLTQGNGGRSNPALMEWLMGFPIGWTDLDVSATRWCRSSFTRCSGG